MPLSRTVSRSAALLPVLLTLLLCLACGGRNRSLEPDELEAELLRSPSATVRILPETYLAGGSARAITLGERQADGAVLLELRAEDAEQLKALYLHLEYDPQQFSPAGVESQWQFASEAESLQLSLAGQPGVLEYGEQCIRPDEPAAAGGHKGLDGDGLLCRIRLDKRPFTPLQREVLTPTVAARSRAFLSLDVDSFELRWGYASNGDYNQNGTVAVTDLTPIGSHFLEDVPGDDQNSIQAVIDGNGSGEIGIADLTAIGLNFGIAVNSYNVYASTDIADVPTENSGANGPGAELKGTVPFSAVQGDQFAARRSFSFALPQSQIGWFYWVRPNDAADGSGADGTPSSVASFGGNAANLDPVAALSADPLSGGNPLEVNFDASGSTDPDGSAGNNSDIVQHQWDFNGDGLIDDVSTTALNTHIYRSAGIKTARVTVFDQGAAFDSASIQITVGAQGNDTPHALLQLSDSAGEAPMTVTLDADQSDNGASSDKTGLSFEWDFEGDGIFDLSSGALSTVTHLYEEAGSFLPTVRVRDEIEQTASKSRELNVAANQGNQAPLAVLQPKPLLADSSDSRGTLLDWDLSQCSDLDGQIVRTVVDLDTADPGDRRLSFSGLPNPLTTFLAPGVRTVEITLFDDDGAVASDSAEARVSLNGNLPPAAKLNVDHNTGDTPLQVSFDAAASTDLDGSITDISFDFDGDGVTDASDLDGQVVHNYVDGGAFTASVTVTDNGGLQSRATVQIATVDPTNTPPSASFELSASSGDAPLLVTIDPGASQDADGSLVLFEWDLTGDGIFDVNDARPDASSFEQAFLRSGDTQISLRVTDNDGATDISSRTLSVQQGWEFGNIASFDAGFLPAPGLLDMAELSTGQGFLRKAGVVFVEGHEAGQRALTPFSAFYSECSPADPLSWTTPVSVLKIFDTNGDGRFFEPDGVDGFRAVSVALTDVSGQPAVAFSGIGASESSLFLKDSLFYVRSEDNAGTSWGQPVNIGLFPLLESPDRLTELELTTVAGRPAIACTRSNGLLNSFEQSLLYTSALDSTGGTWRGLVEVLSDSNVNGASSFGSPAIIVADSFPALFCRHFFSDASNHGVPLFCRANQVEGSSWGTAQVISDSEMAFNSRTVGSLVDGHPGLLFEDQDGKLLYERSLSPAGDFSGSEVRTSATAVSPEIPVALFVAAGKPHLLLARPRVEPGQQPFQGGDTLSLYLQAAADESGQVWQRPAFVTNITDNGLAFSNISQTTLSLVQIRRVNSDLVLVFKENDQIRVGVLRNFLGL